MKLPMLSLLLVALSLPISWAKWSPDPEKIPEIYFGCLSLKIHPSTLISSSFYAQYNASFKTVLESTAQNLKYVADWVQKPKVIFIPNSESDVQVSVYCAKQINVNLRMRSGGHDYEGLSYASLSKTPFIMIDLSKLRTVIVNIEDNSVWMQAGTTNGEVYYRIAEQSKVHGVTAGLCTSLGVGGHVTGGAYGNMMRKYGLAGDNVINARIINAEGEILDQRSMDEDVFWAIKGGGGASFGVVTYIKLKLVPVPETVTVFTVGRTLEQGGTKVLMKWQDVADKLDEGLFIRVLIQVIPTKNNQRTVMLLFNALFLGGADQLLGVMRQSFAELGLTRKDCQEMSWVNSTVYFGSFPAGTPADVLLEAKPAFKSAFKAKLDFVKSTIPEEGLRGLWDIMLKEDMPLMIWNPFGGMMRRIAEDSIPFPHRLGIKFMIQYVTSWGVEDQDSRGRHLAWIRSLYKYMAAFVSENPREAYLNYRDLDLGMSTDKKTSYNRVKGSWGTKYFKNNFDRLVQAKMKTDPHDFFWNEQSIPLAN